MKKTIVIFKYLAINLFILGVFLVFPAQASDGTPKVANYYLKWEISDYETRELAKWDVLILDMEVQKNSPRQLEKIRELNPEIIILAYITSQETNADIYSSQWQRQATLRKKLVSGIEYSWWLKDTKGNRISFWHGTYMLNLSTDCPVNSAGQTWATYLADFMKQEVLSSGMWDGVFYDNIWPDVAWIRGDIDLGDGQMSISNLNRSWVAGTKSMLQYTKQISPGIIIIGNGGISLTYQDSINGMMFENFVSPWESGGTWSGSMKTYDSLRKYNVQPQVVVINSYSQNRNDFAKVRFGLASTILSDGGYFSYDYGNTNHGQLWWYDEYDAVLGRAKMPAVNLLNKEQTSFGPGLWRRDYEQGIVLVNSTSENQRYIFRNEEFEKISGTQDPRTNDGSIINYISLAPGDGAFLFKRSTTVTVNNFYNGYFSRVFNPYGDQLKNGFFSYEDSLPSSAKVIKKTGVTVVAQKGKFSSYGTRNLTINPYGPRYTGQIDVAFFATNEVATGATVGGPQVLVFNLDNGRMTGNFFAFDKSSRSGVNIATGDINGDGRTEIITSQNAGALSEVRVYTGSGKLLSKFMAYDRRFRGGVSVAVGDVNGDGRVDIITSPGSTGGPDVRVYDANGKMLSRFWAYEQSYAGGVKVSVEDLDGDGVLDILASIPNF